MSPLIPLGLILAALGLWLVVRLIRETRCRARSRAAYLDTLRPLFDRVETRLQPTGFPRMTGHRDGLAFDLQVLPDTLTFRKLPALWVTLTLPTPQPVAATLDLMARPSGNEPFSHFASLRQSLPALTGQPPHVAIRTDNASGCLSPSQITPLLDLFDDPEVKELVISPKGLRIVILAEEADRGRYLIFREAEMGMTPLPADRVQPFLDRLAMLSRSLSG